MLHAAKIRDKNLVCLFVAWALPVLTKINWLQRNIPTCSWLCGRMAKLLADVK